jgi:hypothetical protein
VNLSTTTLSASTVMPFTAVFPSPRTVTGASAEPPWVICSRVSPRSPLTQMTSPEDAAPSALPRLAASSAFAVQFGDGAGATAPAGPLGGGGDSGPLSAPQPANTSTPTRPNAHAAARVARHPCHLGQDSRSITAPMLAIERCPGPRISGARTNP